MIYKLSSINVTIPTLFIYLNKHIYRSRLIHVKACPKAKSEICGFVFKNTPNVKYAGSSLRMQHQNQKDATGNRGRESIPL